MTNEFQSLHEQVSQLWWRVPLAWLVTVCIPLGLAKAISDESIPTKGCERGVAPGDSKMAKPAVVWALRYCAVPAVARLAWIHFAALSRPDFAISRLEALAWCVWFVGVVPFWIWCEAELLYLRNSGCGDDAD